MMKFEPAQCPTRALERRYRATFFLGIDSGFARRPAFSFRCNCFQPPRPTEPRQEQKKPSGSELDLFPAYTCRSGETAKQITNLKRLPQDELLEQSDEEGVS